MPHSYLVGIDRVGYPIERNMLALPLQRYRFVRALNVFRAPNWLHYRLRGYTSQQLSNTFFPFAPSRCCLNHLFNGVSIGRKPWVSTFETSLPRWARFLPDGPRWGVISDRSLRIGIEALAGSPCRRLIAMSEAALRVQMAFLEFAAPDLVPEVARKLTVLHPSQVVDSRVASRTWVPEGTVRFCFVGRQFFLKGGVEMLLAFRHLHQSGRRNWRLHIVSSLEASPDRPHLSTRSRRELQGWIADLGPLVTLTDRLANVEVRDLMSESDVSLLPTLADTYGYVVLESQAAGTPVITTNVRALPEINSDVSGWMLRVPVDELGFGLISRGRELESFSSRLVDAMIDVLEALCDDPSQVVPRGRASVDRIRKFHDPASAAARLESIYDQALASSVAA